MNKSHILNILIELHRNHPIHKHLFDTRHFFTGHFLSYRSLINPLIDFNIQNLTPILSLLVKLHTYT